MNLNAPMSVTSLDLRETHQEPDLLWLGDLVLWLSAALMVALIVWLLY